ncbi:MAG: ribosomal RNA small subunit methyltransferase A, partial [Planctomycetales bacterium]
RVMAPSAFWPEPKVHSAIIRVALRPDLRARIPDLKFFHRFTRSMFFHRRKFLRAELLSSFKGRLDKPDVDAVRESIDLGPTARAEELSVEQMLELSEAMRQKLLEKFPDEQP